MTIEFRNSHFGPPDEATRRALAIEEEGRRIKAETDRRVAIVRHAAVMEAVGLLRRRFAFLYVGQMFTDAIQRDRHRPQWPGSVDPRPGEYPGANDGPAAGWIDATPRW